MRDFTLSQADDLYELVTERVGKPSIFTANRQASDWYSLLSITLFSPSRSSTASSTPPTTCTVDGKPPPQRRPGGKDRRRGARLYGWVYPCGLWVFGPEEG